MLASFVAAFSSTQATQMNWGSSYLVNDLYRRFIKRDASEKHYVLASRLATALTLVLSLIATQFMDQISHAWQFLLMLGAGTGLVYILRWYWWRVNAWSEVSAMAAALIVSLSIRNFIDSSSPNGFAIGLIITTAATTLVWLVVTMLTQPEPRATLDAFYKKVRPAGPGWGVIARESGIEPVRGELGRNAHRLGRRHRDGLLDHVRHRRGDLSQRQAVHDLRQRAGRFGRVVDRDHAQGKGGDRSADDADGTQIKASLNLRPSASSADEAFSQELR